MSKGIKRSPSLPTSPPAQPAVYKTQAFFLPFDKLRDHGIASGKGNRFFFDKLMDYGEASGKGNRFFFDKHMDYGEASGKGKRFLITSRNSGTQIF